MKTEAERTGALLVRLHSLGDIVLASNTVEYLSGISDVHFMTRSEYTPLVRRMPGKPVPVPLGWNEGACSIRRYRRQISPNIVIDLQNNLTTLLGLGLLGVERFRTDRRLRRKVLSGSASTMPLRKDEYLRTAGAGKVLSVPPLSLIRKSFPEPGRLSIGIVTGGRWRSKVIPDGIVEECCRLFADRLDAEITLIGTDNRRSELIASASGRPGISVAAKGGVENLINRIETLNLLVSPDSGPAHIACALGVPVLVVFMSTAPSLGFWEAGFPGIFMAGDVPCRPCHRHGGDKCRQGEWLCGKQIVPLELAEAAESLILR